VYAGAPERGIFAYGSLAPGIDVVGYDAGPGLWGIDTWLVGFHVVGYELRLCQLRHRQGEMGRLLTWIASASDSAASASGR
jgi:hypothetical protein